MPISLTVHSHSWIALMILKDAKSKQRGSVILQMSPGEQRGICQLLCLMGPSPTFSSPPGSCGEDAQVKRRRFRPTKRLPTQTVQVGKGGQQAMVNAARYVLLPFPHVVSGVDTVSSTSRTASRLVAIPLLEPRSPSPTVGHEHVGTLVVPTRHQPARHCKNMD